MNERIRELADQAAELCQTDYESESQRKRRLYNEIFLSKFAELIVAECGKVVVNGGYRNPALGEKHPLTPPEIATMIKEHFGVEE